MALFGDRESKEEKQAAKQEAILDRYGLKNIRDPEVAEALKHMTAGMAGNRMIEVGTALGGSAQDVAKISYLRVLMEQNFLIIKLLDELVGK